MPYIMPLLQVCSHVKNKTHHNGSNLNSAMFPLWRPPHPPPPPQKNHTPKKKKKKKKTTHTHTQTTNNNNNNNNNNIRINIGGIRGTSHQKLYIESGFCTLKERRKRHKLLMFHKMILGLCPQYISDLLPPLVAHINPYHRRRPLERDVTTCKTELYRNSFIPSTTAEWNSLPVSVQQSTSLSVF